MLRIRGRNTLLPRIARRRFGRVEIGDWGYATVFIAKILWTERRCYSPTKLRASLRVTYDRHKRRLQNRLLEWPSRLMFAMYSYDIQAASEFLSFQPCPPPRLPILNRFSPLQRMFPERFMGSLLNEEAVSLLKR